MYKVLVVDDDAVVVASFAHMLRLAHYDVLTAPDAPTALLQMESFRPDVVLVDLRMPLMDAVDFVKRVRILNGHSRTPIAVVTGDYFIDETKVSDLERLQTVVYFKPVWLEDLLEITARLVAKIG